MGSDPFSYHSNAIGDTVIQFGRPTQMRQSLRDQILILTIILNLTNTVVNIQQFQSIFMEMAI